MQGIGIFDGDLLVVGCWLLIVGCWLLTDMSPFNPLTTQVQQYACPFFGWELVIYITRGVMMKIFRPESLLVTAPSTTFLLVLGHK